MPERRAEGADSDGEESGWMIGRGVVVVITSIVLFAVVFLVTTVAGLLLTGRLEQSALIGGVCGFAVAWLTNTAYIIAQRTRGETRRQTGSDEDGPPDNDTNR